MFDPPARVPWSRLGAETIESPAHLRAGPARPQRARWCCSRTEPARCRSGASVRNAGGRRSHGGRRARASRELPRHPTHPVTLLDGIRAGGRGAGRRRRYAPGARLVEHVDRRKIADAVERRPRRRRGHRVSWASIRGWKARSTDERLNPGGDRQDLGLPAAQRELVEALLATGKPVVAGADGRQRARGSLATAAAAAIALRLVSGRRGRNARSPTCCSATSTRRDACRSRFTARPPTCRRSRTTTCAGRTYRYFDGEPLYRFGYGLSYTTFRYAQIGAVAAAASRRPRSRSRTPDHARATRSCRPTSSRATPRLCAAPLAGGVLARLLKPGEHRVVKIPSAPTRSRTSTSGDPAPAGRGRRHRGRRATARARRPLPGHDHRQHHDAASRSLAAPARSAGVRLFVKRRSRRP